MQSYNILSNTFPRFREKKETIDRSTSGANQITEPLMSHPYNCLCHSMFFNSITHQLLLLWLSVTDMSPPFLPNSDKNRNSLTPKIVAWDQSPETVFPPDEHPVSSNNLLQMTVPRHGSCPHIWKMLRSSIQFWHTALWPIHQTVLLASRYMCLEIFRGAADSWCRASSTQTWAETEHRDAGDENVLLCKFSVALVCNMSDDVKCKWEFSLIGHPPGIIWIFCVLDIRYFPDSAKMYFYLKWRSSVIFFLNLHNQCNSIDAWLSSKLDLKGSSYSLPY